LEVCDRDSVDDAEAEGCSLLLPSRLPGSLESIEPTGEAANRTSSLKEALAV
jgi:hypothetical protein